jgi:hypothetical protein
MGEWGVASVLLKSALDGGEWSASLRYRFNPGDVATGIHCGVGPRVGLDIRRREKSHASTTIEPRPFGRLALSLVAVPTDISLSQW